MSDLQKRDPEQLAQLVQLLRLSDTNHSTQRPEIHIHISDSFNQVNSHNTRYHTEQPILPQKPEVSKIVPMVFLGAWAISIFVVLLVNSPSNQK